MAKGFKYDVVLLIESIRNRPCLWDKSIENYKDRVERKTAWEEIFRILDDKYDELSAEDKIATGELIQHKWTNIRDTFVRTLKTKMGKPKKKYLLHDNLKFLIRVIPEREYNIDYNEDTSSCYMKQEMEEANTSYVPTRKKKRIEQTDDYVPKKSRRERNKSPDSDYETYDTATANIDFVEVDSKVESDPRLMNEDEAFFASLLPSVVRYNEDERLEFRIEVLAVMKKIKDKRNWQCMED